MTKTLLGTEINSNIRGIIYICDYENFKLTVKSELLFTNTSSAIICYGEIPNPPSQIAIGKTHDEFIKSLNTLHERMQSEEWQKQLADYL